MGLMMYVQDYDEKMPLYYFTGSVSYAWNHVLNPYIKNNNVFVCPSATPILSWCGPTAVASWQSGSYGYSQYLGNLVPVALAAVQMPSQTIAIGEITQTQDQSMFYAPSTWGNAKTGICDGATRRGDQIATRHFEGMITVFMDGHTKWLKKTAVQDYNNDGAIDDGWFAFTKP